MKDTKKVFSFTLRQQTKTKGFKAAIIAGVLLCLLLPGIVMSIIELTGDEPAGLDHAHGIKTVHVVDSGDAADYGILNTLGYDKFSDIEYELWDSLDAAEKAAGVNDLILVVAQENGEVILDLLLPETCSLTWDDADAMGSFLQETFSYILVEKSGLDYQSIAALMQPISISAVTGDPAAADSMAEIRSILAIVLTYVFGMLIYFMLLFFCNGVSNSVIAEKSSKLMENFLLSVKPAAMITGKTLAISLAAMVQFFSWIAALMLGFFLGSNVVRLINPQTELLQIFSSLSRFKELFSIPGVILGIVLAMAGFLLYCSIAALCGSIAGKQEDLSSTNMLYTMILIFSFFLTIASSVSQNPALAWIPFTSILYSPGRLMIGEVSLATGVIALLLTLLVCLVVMLLSGKLYKLLALHKGDVPKPGKIIAMLRKDS